jgi:hypothetical protein
MLDLEMSIAEADAEKRSEKLIKEFEAHFEEYLTFRPEDITRKREVFESWAIQKIAGLQLSVEYIGKHMQKLEEAVKRKKIG